MRILFPTLQGRGSMPAILNQVKPLYIPMQIWLTTTLLQRLTGLPKSLEDLLTGENVRLGSPLPPLSMSEGLQCLWDGKVVVAEPEWWSWRSWLLHSEWGQVELAKNSCYPARAPAFRHLTDQAGWAGVDWSCRWASLKQPILAAMGLADRWAVRALATASTSWTEVMDWDELASEQHERPGDRQARRMAEYEQESHCSWWTTGQVTPEGPDWDVEALDSVMPWNGLIWNPTNSAIISRLGGGLAGEIFSSPLRFLCGSEISSEEPVDISRGT